MLRSRLALAVAFAPLCAGGISPVGGSHANSGSTAAPAKLSINYSSSKGNTVALTCALGNASYSIKTVTDTGGSPWSRRASATGMGLNSEIWTTTAGGALASSSFTVTPSNPVPISCALEEYSGVLALGHTGANSGNSSSGLVTVATQDANDYVVAAISVGSYNSQTGSSGKIRQSGGLTGNVSGNLVGNTLTDNTAPTPSGVTCSNTFGREPWAAAAIEFRSVRDSGSKASTVYPDWFAPTYRLLAELLLPFSSHFKAQALLPALLKDSF